jgi:hypothetical protein
MEPVTLEALRAFLQELGERSTNAVAFYLLGGSALALLGSPRTTVDVDYTFEADEGRREEFEATVADLADEMRLDLELVPIGEFVPLPPRAHERRQLVDHFGPLGVYIFDPYTIALSKIARGFEADLDDVMFLLRESLIDFGELEQYFVAILPDVAEADIAPGEFRDFFEEIRRRWEGNPSPRPPTLRPAVD